MNPLHLCPTLDEVTQGLEVRTATTELEISQLREALKTQHYLGAIVTLCRHDDGRPVLMQSHSGKKEDCELPVAQKLLADNTGVMGAL